MEFKPSKNLPEQIAHYLEDRILRFKLKPGQRLVEEELSRELGISRSPLREAHRILEKKWLIDLIPRREARVTILNENLISCSGDILKEVYGLVARRASELGTEEERAIISEKLSHLDKYASQNNPTGYFEAIIEYETECLKAARNPVLNLLLKDLWPSSRRVQYATLHLRTESLMEPVSLFKQAHQMLLDGNGDRAAAIIRDLIQQETMYGIKYLPQFTTL
jgi:DNA-binding GntR family transcriptional regulator